MDNPYQLEGAFTFKGDARSIYDRFMSERVIDVQAEYPPVMRFVLDPCPTNRADLLCGIALAIALPAGPEPFNATEHADDIAEIFFEQTAQGESRALFYVNVDPACWGGESSDLWYRGRPLVVKLWQSLINDTLAQPAELQPGKQRDSGHFNYSREKRRAIVKAFHAARDRGEVDNIEAWAQSNHNIGRKTLRNYEKEFEAET